MSGSSGFNLRGRNPDILTCIANLSNDEVFTPPEFANQMLDTLTEAWAADHAGANIWADKSVRFLDPCTKSGVFLREITRRLIEGLAEEIPDLQERVDHILTQQVFGIGITQLTAMLARRSVYCSRHASGNHSVAKTFDSDEGRIWFKRTEHTWKNGKCKYCGASRGALDRGKGAETHAYAFIHAKDLRAGIGKWFGKRMQFNVIIGNPPYQLASDGGTRDVPIYQHFVEKAKELDPEYLVMVIPSRWMATGLGLSQFREDMLADRSIRRLVDYPVASEVFPGVEVKAGVCYFLRERNFDGSCQVTTVRGGLSSETQERRLDEFDVFVRDSNAVSILQKVLALEEPSVNTILARDKEFGWTSNFDGFRARKMVGDVPLHYIRAGKRSVGYIPREAVLKSLHLIDVWKVMVPKAGSDGGQRIPDVVLGKPLIASSPSVCTQSFLFFYCETKEQARSITSYYQTKFFRFLVSLRKMTQDATHSTYTWVPLQSWDFDWTDEILYSKYSLTDEERSYIEQVIRPMDVDLFGGLLDE
jgi:site-specific DNA-methyltransferase (adenine-specific)